MSDERIYTTAEIESAIDEEFEGWPNEFYSELGTDGYELTELEIRAYEVDREGGYEGGGEYMHLVFKVGNQYFRKTGEHNSWDANTWDGELEEVEPYEVTVVRYREVKR